MVTQASAGPDTGEFRRGPCGRSWARRPSGGVGSDAPQAERTSHSARAMEAFRGRMGRAFYYRRQEPEAPEILRRVRVLEGAPLRIDEAPLLLRHDPGADGRGDLAEGRVSVPQHPLHRGEGPAGPEGVQPLEPTIPRDDDRPLLAAPGGERGGSAPRRGRACRRRRRRSIRCGRPAGRRAARRGRPCPGGRRARPGRRAPATGAGSFATTRTSSNSVAEEGEGPLRDGLPAEADEALRHSAHAPGPAAGDEDAGAVVDPLHAPELTVGRARRGGGRAVPLLEVRA